MICNIKLKEFENQKLFKSSNQFSSVELNNVVGVLRGIFYSLRISRYQVRVGVNEDFPFSPRPSTLEGIHLER